jgi:hypothetical protein
MVKRVVLALVLVAFVSTLHAQSWVTAGVQVNPAANAILADSGPVTFGTHKLTIIVASTAAAVVVLEHRNAANSANLESQIIPVNANVPFAFALGTGLDTAEGERIRLRLNAAITGSVQGSIFIE